MAKLGGWSVALSILVLGVSTVHAQGVSAAPQTKVRLTASQPVYKLGSAGGVQFTLTNGTSQTLTMSTPTPWSVYQGNKLVHTHISIQILGQILPGQSKTWVWNMTNTSGSPVSAGSYTIKVGQLWLGQEQFTRSVTVALTPTGTIAGSSPFPLAVGNEWSFIAGPGLFFNAPSPYVTMKVANKSGTWFKVKNLVGVDRSAKMSGGAQPTLSVMALIGGDAWGSVSLFRFNRPLGYSYTVGAPPLVGAKLKVGSKNDTLQTPVGTFKNCYRLDVHYPPNALVGFGYKSFWFAPGVGLVGYNKFNPEGPMNFRLESAKIKGSNGKLYSLKGNH